MKKFKALNIKGQESYGLMWPESITYFDLLSFLLSLISKCSSLVYSVDNVMESDGRETNCSGKQLKSICYAGTELLSCLLNLYMLLQFVATTVVVAIISSLSGQKYV